MFKTNILAFRRIVVLLSQARGVHIALLVVASFAFFTYRIGAESLWLDEVFTYYASNNLQQLIDTITWKEKNMWFYHILMFFWNQLGIAFGLSGEFFIRFPSTIFATAGVLALYFLVNRLTGKLSAGFSAAALMLISGMYLQYAQEARAYSLYILLFLVSTYLFIEIIRHYKRKKLIFYGIAAVLSIYTHVFATFFVVIQGIFMLLQFRRDLAKVRDVIGTYLLIGICLLPIALPRSNLIYERDPVLSAQLITAQTNENLIGMTRGSLSWVKPPDLSHLIYFVRQLTSNSNAILMVYLQLLFVGFVHYVLDKRKISRNELVAPSYFLSILVFPLTISFILSYLIFPIFVTRYFVFVLPALIILIVFALQTIENKLFRFGFLLLLLLLHLNVSSFYFNNVDKEQWKEVVLELKSKVDSNTKVLTYPNELSLPLKYYSDRVGTTLPLVLPVHTGVKEYPIEPILDLLSDIKNDQTVQRIFLVSRKSISPDRIANNKEKIINQITQVFSYATKEADYHQLEVIEYRRDKK
ncbi:MAG: glycosyltransferase family 39 protein [Patescibacteria group bacterium]|nr:glycosyltransferase family 39 protein [Patescibacteria group bacterium]